MSRKRHWNIRSISQELERLHRRIDSQNKRLRRTTEHCSQILAMKKHYLKYRFPAVLKHQQCYKEFNYAYKRATEILKHIRMSREFKTRHVNRKGECRFIGLFTHVEMTRIRKLLIQDWRKKLVKRRKGQNLVYLNDGDLANLNNLLKRHRRKHV